MTVVVDTSAVLAVLLEEPSAEQVAECLAAADLCLMPAPTLVEAAIVAEARLGPAGALALQRLLREAGIVVEPFGPSDAHAAVDAWRRFGKGRHPAGLNLGDCYAYASAQVRGCPLLYVGGDFARTDIESAMSR